MTQAICICCGEGRVGAYTKCEVCQFEPGTGWDFAVSIIASDQTLDSRSLQSLAQSIRAHYARGEGKPLNFDASAVNYITSMLDAPDFRDMFTLTRAARDGFFSKQMNWHSEGPDGYSALVVTRGKEIPKAQFDAMVAENGPDAFFIDVYEGGEKSSTQVNKRVWYCLRDINLYLERQLSDNSEPKRLLTRAGRKFTLDYLKSRHRIDMTGVA